MAIRVVRLGSPRAPGEGLRLGTVRRPPEATRLLILLAALSRGTNLAVGCYCADEARCHRSILRALLLEHGATLA
jgi:uncharacterized protein YeaO (DUF488 family)